jgi:glyoxylase-like metal-dependent hydrolase (beta-lactamase superfamily II)
MREIDRRTLIAAGLGGLLIPRFRPARLAGSPFRWTQIGADAWVVERGGGNTTVLRERGGAVVIDVKFGGMGYALEREVRARVGPIQGIIVTHHHDDHSEGLAAFLPRRAHAYRAAVPRIRADTTRMTAAVRKDREGAVAAIFATLARDFEVRRTGATEPDVRRFVDWASHAEPDGRVPPDPLDAETNLTFGSTSLEVVHPGPAHTDNDIFVVDRRRNLLVAGDLLFHRHHPFVDRAAGATTEGWQRAIDRMTMDLPRTTIVVPGHGPVTRPEALAEQRRYFSVVRDLVVAERKAGRSREEILKLPNREFSRFGFVDLWKENLGVLFDELGP